MIENKISETGEPCGIACVKGWGDSQLLSKLNDSVQFEVKSFVQLMRYVGILRWVIIWSKIYGIVLLKAPRISWAVNEGRLIYL
jgi:hypothetical protein